jgi:ferredoxin
MKALVSREDCIGCGACIELCPEVFTWDDDETAIVSQDPVPGSEEEACREAAESCPTEAITIQ